MFATAAGRDQFAQKITARGCHLAQMDAGFRERSSFRSRAIESGLELEDGRAFVMEGLRVGERPGGCESDHACEQKGIAASKNL